MDRSTAAAQTAVTQPKVTSLKRLRISVITVTKIPHATDADKMALRHPMWKTLDSASWTPPT
jgi:hypothetical protein